MCRSLFVGILALLTCHLHAIEETTAQTCQMELCPFGTLLCTSEKKFCKEAAATCPQCKDCPGGEVVCDNDIINPHCPTGTLLCTKDDNFCARALDQCKNKPLLCQTALTTCAECRSCTTSTPLCPEDEDFCTIAHAQCKPNLEEIAIPLTYESPHQSSISNLTIDLTQMRANHEHAQIRIIKKNTIHHDVWLQHDETNDWIGRNECTIAKKSPTEYTILSPRHGALTIPCTSDACPPTTISCFQREENNHPTPLSCREVVDIYIEENITSDTPNNTGPIIAGQPLAVIPVQPDELLISPETITSGICITLKKRKTTNQKIWFFEAATKKWLGPNQITIHAPTRHNVLKTYRISDKKEDIFVKCTGNICSATTLQCVNDNSQHVNCSEFIEASIGTCTIQ